MKRILMILTCLILTMPQVLAVLKEKDIDHTLSILRSELTAYHRELSSQTEKRKNQGHEIGQQLMMVLQKSNQNALMLYSQKQDYVFDQTYACHEATKQYQDFQRQQLPFRTFVNKAEIDIARYDSLIISLKEMQTSNLSDSARIDRNVCLTLATSIRNTLEASNSNLKDYIRYYEMTEHRLQGLNDFAQKRYNDIQTSIFINGGEDYFTIISNGRQHIQEMKRTVKKKYAVGQDSGNDVKSQWNSLWIVLLFGSIIAFVIVAITLNQLFFRFLLPKRLQTPEFMKKRPCIIMATTSITFAIIQGLLTHSDQHFLAMASNLLVEYAWLLGVIFISLLLRVSGEQIKSSFRIYAPLIIMGFMVIAFRIILIPNELVNLIFPPMLLVSSLWQWSVIIRHGRRIPGSDRFYAYISLVVFIASVCCSWSGYTLLAVQVLIWWIMQLTCILTITCFSQWLRLYAERHHYEQKPVTKRWLYELVENVALPVTAVCSVMLSIYWAAGVFNLSDLCWQLFNRNFIDMENLRVSIVRLSIVVCFWFFFRYLCSTTLSMLHMHYESKDPSTAESRLQMSKNVIQIFIWGIWLLGSMSLLHISVAWLLAISGGLSTGIGFASKNIIENIFYGASLMTGRIKVGDWIEVNNTMGKVTNISYTSTVVESLYGEIITFQNSQLFTNNYKNLTRNHGYVLAVVPYGVAYGSNIRQVIELVDGTVNKMNHQWMDRSKKVKSVVYEMGDSSVNLKMFVWAIAPKKSYVVSDVMKTIYETLNEHGIEIPFPQRDIHIKS